MNLQKHIKTHIVEVDDIKLEVKIVSPAPLWGKIMCLIMSAFFIWGTVVSLQEIYTLGTTKNTVDVEVVRYIKNGRSVFPVYKHLVVIDGKERRLRFQRATPNGNYKILWAGGSKALILDNNNLVKPLDIFGGIGQFTGLLITTIFTLLISWMTIKLFTGRVTCRRL